MITQLLFLFRTAAMRNLSTHQYVYNYPQGGIKELIRHDALSEVGAHIVDIGSIDSVIMDDGCIYVPENPEN